MEFKEELQKQLMRLMVDHKDEKKSPYSWWQGQNDIEQMKRVFMARYLESTLYQYEGYSQKEYLDWIMDLIAQKKRKKEQRKKVNKGKIKLNLEKHNECCGPIYDDDEKPTYYKW
ncbi:hypothetical protein [Megasphaera elsdenii]|uniref:hypothetical protein n=1 Tax=Megasphaera elsdenii TaxID=907 RepID=UPI003FEEFF65